MAEPTAGTYVEVVYATADRQRIVRLPFARGLTAWRAVTKAGAAK